MRRIILLSSYLIASICYGQPHTLDTLAHIAAYLDEVPQAPAADGDDWYNPSFHTYYQRQEAPVLTQLGRMLGIFSPIWDVKELYNALVDVTKQRKDITFTTDHMGEPSQTIPVAENAECIIWGDLHGALHSFYRGLYELHQQGKIDDSLTLQDENLYVCVIGDAIDRSPYSLEVLTIILHMMQQNPNRVIYIRGNHETNSYWTNFATRESLKQKARHLSDEDIPLQTEVDSFFNTLPRAVYMHIEGASGSFVHLSHKGRELHELVFDKTDIQYIKDISASIRGEARSEVLGETDGMNLLGFHYGSAEWSLLSCPVWVYQHFFGFMYDAFASLQFASDVDSAAITLYNRKVNSTNNRFNRAETYDLTSGKKLEAEKQEGTQERLSSLWFGSTIAISGGLEMQGPSLKRGITEAVKQANNAGGIKNSLLRPMIFDDDYLPHRALQNATYLLDDFDIHVFLAPTGTPTLQAYADKVKAARGAVLCPVTGAPQFRTPDASYMVHFRPSYPDEARALTKHVIDTYKTHRLAFLYQDDDFGRPLRDAAIQTLKEYGIDDWLAVPYVIGQVDFGYEAQKIRQYNPSAIGLFSTITASKEIIRELDAAFLMGRPLFGNSDLGTFSFQQFIREHGLRCVIARAVPNPKESTLPIAQEFRERMDISGWPYDVFAFEGFIATQLFVQALREIAAPIQIDRMLQWFEGLQQYQFKGLELTFNPQKRDLGQNVTVETIV